MIKGKWLVIILIVLLLLFNGVRFFSSYQAKQMIKSDTITHLQEKGYDKEDIYETDVVNVGGNDLEYATVITFADERDVDYLYTYKPDSNEIIQLDAGNKEESGNLKHLENTDL